MSAIEKLPEQFFQLAGPEDCVLGFSGPPRAVIGMIPVVNISDDKQKIRSISINSKELRGPGGVPLSEIPFRTRLQGHQQANLRARLPLDPLTPPGSYNFEVTVGPRTLRAVAHISEVFDFRVEPRAITIFATAKISSHTGRVVCENRGNVVLVGGDRCEVPIFEAYPLLSAVLNGLNKSDRVSAESMAKAALIELADLKVGTLVVKRRAMALSPGQKVAVDIGFELPAGLKPQRRYSASLELYNTNLQVEIYTTANPGPNSSKQQ
jgi:hypothetical protein